MARSIKEIYDEMILEKQTMSTLTSLQPNVSSYQNLLNDLTTQSKVAVWRLLFFVVAVSIWVVEKQYDELLQDIEQQIQELTPGTLYWYQHLALNFQYGDSLVWNPIKLKYEYPTINESNKIIKLCSVSEGSGFLNLKLAKKGALGPEKLSSLELTSFQSSYMERLKYAGVVINYISEDPDKIRLNLKIYIDPSVLSPAGSLLTNPTIFPVIDCVKNYLQLIPFNGLFNVTDLIDELQKVKGVVNPLFVSASAQYGSYPFAPVVDYYRPFAGYMIHDETTPINIEYLAL